MYFNLWVWGQGQTLLSCGAKSYFRRKFSPLDAAKICLEPEISLCILQTHLSIEFLWKLTDCRNKRRRKGVVWKPEKDTSFTDTRVSDKEEFEQQIVRFLSHYSTIYVSVARISEGIYTKNKT